MKFVTFNTKSILVIFAILFTITITFINSSEVVSSIKTNNQIKNKSLLKYKSHSKLTLHKKFSMFAPPGSVMDLNPELNKPTPPTVPVPEVKVPETAPVVVKKPAAPKVVRATKGTGDVLMNDWLSISSKGFHNNYSEIDMGFHGDNIKIKTDSFDFRINDAFGKDKNPVNQPPTEELFWFRLTKDLFFYSNTRSDLNLLGGMKITEIVESDEDKKGPNGEHCFVITDSANHDWQVCSVHELVRNTYFCKIQELRKEPSPHYCHGMDGVDNIKIIVKNVSKIIFKLINFLIDRSTIYYHPNPFKTL